MARVVLIAGLPGSGKTCLAETLVRQGFVLVDDPRGPEGYVRVRAALETGRDVVVVDPMLCRADTRIAVEMQVRAAPTQPGSTRTVEWIFFANDPEQCRRNVARRADGRVVDPAIYNLSKVYRPPAGADVRPVWGGGDAPVRQGGKDLAT
jgi:hypothetical protein